MHSSAYSVPSWSREAIWYQIFPERFHNGDHSNDPTLYQVSGAWPHDPATPWEVHPWTSDWYALAPYEQVRHQDFWHHVQRRRYGGDLAGILQKLDYLEELGITALYLNPIFAAPSSHKYDGQLLHHVDPHFGPDPESDWELIEREELTRPSTWQWTSADRLLLELIAAVHQRGMRIILDGVFNHFGIQSPFFRDVLVHQQHSTYADWFKIESWDDEDKGTHFHYRGWEDVPELPEIIQIEGDLAPGPKAYVHAATRRWMDPHGQGDTSAGIDGWRLDVAAKVGLPFWREWRDLAKSINPEAYLVGEVFTSDEELPQFLRGDTFDAIMNYPFAELCALHFYREQPAGSTSQLAKSLLQLSRAYPPGVAHAMQNLLDSHDTARAASQVVNAARMPFENWTEFHPQSQRQKNPHLLTRKPNALEQKRLELAIALQMTFVGAPMIYYGDEAGMWGLNDPCCRKPMLWDDRPYSDEAALPDGGVRDTPDTVQFDRACFATYQDWIALRRQSAALRLGDFAALPSPDELLLFRRSHANDTVIVALNRSESPIRTAIDHLENTTWIDPQHQRPHQPDAQGKLSLDIPPLSPLVLRQQR